jgi:hypothetical protein
MVSEVQGPTKMICYVGNDSQRLRAAARHSFMQLRRSITVVAAAKPRLSLGDGAHGVVCERYEPQRSQVRTGLI